MYKQILLVLAVAATLGLAACGQGDDAKKAAEAAKEATQAAGEKVSEATEAAKEKVSDAAEAAKEKVSDAAGAAVEKGQEMAQATIDKANELIQQAKDYIAENRIDLAETVMEQLRALRDSLPQGLQDEIAKLDAMLSGEQPAAAPAPTGN
jgi:ABC-type transporter Mla subunit MlaD